MCKNEVIAEKNHDFIIIYSMHSTLFLLIEVSSI